jgi:RNA polymerase sigma-70 factor (ECF subfamily)
MDELTRLAVAARDGDRDSLERFVRRIQGDVWRLCRYLSDDGDADDLAQETLLRVLRALPSFRAEASARTWVLSIAQRTCADDVRRRVRRRRLFDRVSRTTTERDVADHADVHALGALVGTLEDDRRSAFVLTQVIGLSYDEAADVLGCPIGTIRSRVARARQQLVDAARDQDEDGQAYFG